MYDAALNEREPRLDWLLIAALGGLIAVGLAFVYSATSVTDPVGLGERFRDTGLWEFAGWLFRQMYFKQLIWCVGGIGLAIAVCLVDYRSLSRWALVAYWISILLLIAVFFVGKTVYGATRWIDLGPFNLQPSEFAKLAFIFALAHFLSRPLEELKRRDIFLKALGLAGLPFVLILKEPDLGSALLFLPVGLVMMYVAGVPARYLTRLVGGAGLLVLLLLLNILFAPPKFQIKLEDYQRHRLLVYFNQDFAPPDATPAERKRYRELQRQKSYNVEQALISVGSGGLLGKGWCEGTQNALGFLPRGVAHNDFIFSVIAEEKGFVGSVIVLMLYTVVLFTGLRIASQARDRLGKILAAGVVTLFFSQIFINIGMNIRLMPVTGVPLPLLSYGGSSVLSSLIAIGILQNIYIHRKSY